MQIDVAKPFGATTIHQLTLSYLSRLFPPHQPIDAHLKILLWGSKRSGKTSILYRWKLETFIPTVPTVGLLEETFLHRSQLRMDAKLSRIDIAEVGRDPITVEMRSCCPVKIEESDSDEEDDLRSSSPCDKKRRGGATFLPLRQAKAAIKCCSRCCLRCLQLKLRQKSADFAIETWTRVIQKTNAIVYVIDSTSRTSLMEMFDDVNFIMSNDSSALRYARIIILANKQDVVGALTPLDIERMLDLPQPFRKRIRVFGTSALTGQNIEESLLWLEDMVYEEQHVQMNLR